MRAKFEIKSFDGRVLKVFEHYIALTQKGLRGLLSRGLSGEKIIYYNDITSVQFKNCGWTAGYMEFTFPSSGDKNGGLIGGINSLSLTKFVFSFIFKN